MDRLAALDWRRSTINDVLADFSGLVLALDCDVRRFQYYDYMVFLPNRPLLNQKWVHRITPYFFPCGIHKGVLTLMVLTTSSVSSICTCRAWTFCSNQQNTQGEGLPETSESIRSAIHGFAASGDNYQGLYLQDLVHCHRAGITWKGNIC